MSEDNPSSDQRLLELELAVDEHDESTAGASVTGTRTFQNVCTQITSHWPTFCTTLQALWFDEQPDREGSVTVILVETDRIHELNRDYRDKDRPTDVLTFDLSDDEETVEGEIYIGVPVAIQQAERAGVSHEEEFARLMIHGLLHLAGHDHHTPAEGRRMAQATRRWLTPLMSSIEHVEKESRSRG